MAEPVSPVDHSATPAQPLIWSVTGSPAQILSVLQITSGAGGPGDTVIVMLPGVLAQVPILQIAVYVAVVAEVTIICAPVAPVLQVIVPAQLAAVSVTGLLPQTDRSLAVIVGVVGVFTMIVIAFDATLVQLPFLQTAV